jgi:hypothetical protein
MTHWHSLLLRATTPTGEDASRAQPPLGVERNLSISCPSCRVANPRLRLISGLPQTRTLLPRRSRDGCSGSRRASCDPPGANCPPPADPERARLSFERASERDLHQVTRLSLEGIGDRDDPNVRFQRVAILIPACSSDGGFARVSAQIERQRPCDGVAVVGRWTDPPSGTAVNCALRCR